MRTLRMVALCLLAAGLLSTATVGFARQDDHAITLNLVDADLRDALTMLFRGSDKNFVLAGDANPAARVTMKLVGVDFESALQAILQQVGLRSQVAGGVYTISRAPTTRRTKQERETPIRERTEPVKHDLVPPLRHDDNTFETSTSEGSEKVTEAIKVLYGDAAEIATLFGGEVASGRSRSGFGTGRDYGHPGSWGPQYGSGSYRGYPPQSDAYRNYVPGSDSYRTHPQRRGSYPGYYPGAGAYGRSSVTRPPGSVTGWRY